MECTFVVGDKVTPKCRYPCWANERPPYDTKGVEVPMFGTIYTVREVFVSSIGSVGLRLIEISNTGD